MEPITVPTIFMITPEQRTSREIETAVLELRRAIRDYERSD
jgi:hypothetical protein